MTTSGFADGIVDSRFFSTKRISILLDDSNYLLWRQQVLLAIKTYKLQRFLDLNTVLPPQAVPGEDGVAQENVEFTRFEQQDGAIASWLLSSVSQSVLPHLIGLDTSAQIWNAIVSLYGSQTTSRLMFYRRALHSQRKGDLPMKEFLMKIKSYCDHLASCREIISEREHVTAILNGLPSEYESIISIIVASQHPYSVHNVTNMLIDTETRQQAIMTEVLASANLVSQQASDADSNSRSSSYRPSITRGHGRGRSSGGRVQCQLCGKLGHLVDRCYHRFDASYKNTGYRPPPQANMCVYGSGSSPWIQPSVPMMPSMMPAPWSPSPGWAYQATPSPSWTNPFISNPLQPAAAAPSTTPQSNAYLATAETVGDNAWSPDSGATHHLTHSASNLGESPSQSGPGKVYVGNGNVLHVLCSGQSSLLTRSRPLYMKSLLLTPRITKNLLSVSKFTRDNQVMFEFLPTQYQVRDLKTKEVLLHGSVHHGLYKLHLKAAAKCDQVPSNAHCFTASTRIPLSVWHSRLGHPCKSVLLKALQSCNKLIDVNKEDFACVACHLGKEHRLPFSNSVSAYSAPLQLVVADVWGPAPVTSNGFRYYIAFMDAYTRYTWVYFLHRKSERFTCPYTSAQNGLVERKHRQIVETGLSMLAHASMPITYWNDAFSYAVYLLNQLPTAPLAFVSPYEKLFQAKPNYSFLTTFSCLCFPNLRPYNGHKLLFRSTPYTFLGYSPLHKGYRCQASNGRVYISRHVTFHEFVFPFASTITNHCSSTPYPQYSSKLLVLSPDIFPPRQTPCVNPPVPSSPNSPTPSHSNSNSLTSHLPLSSSTVPIQPLTNASSPPVPTQLTANAPLAVPHNSHAMVTRSKAGIFKPKVYLSTVPCSDIPVDIHVAMAHKCWADDVNTELQALERNNTWTLCSLPSHRRTIGCKWLFKVKTKADGTLDRYKARLVAKGFSQHAGIDFRDMFSRVVRAVTIRFVLATAVMKQWQLRQVDVNNAFLNGELTEEIFLDQPLGFEVFDSAGQRLVCRLNKALYGLRQAPRAWFHTPKQYLTDMLGFHALKADPSLFIRTSSDSQLLLMAYVDNIVITGSSDAAIDDVVRQLHNKFALKDMGRLNFFLGIEVRTTPQGLYLSQIKYAQEILTKAGMIGAAATPTPMVCMPKLVASDESQAFPDGHLYRSTVGMLQYLCITRPDLSFCVNKLRQCKLVGYSDADWASSVEDRRSTTGYVIYLGENPIAWCSKKQAVVSRSSSEAEYRSLSNCVSEVLWVKQLLEEIGVGLKQTSVIWCDNTSTVFMSANPTHHAKVKHVEIDHHFVREKVLDGTLQVNYVPSANQVADVLTKPVPPKQGGGRSDRRSLAGAGAGHRARWPERCKLLMETVVVDVTSGGGRSSVRGSWFGAECQGARGIGLLGPPGFGLKFG
ncbi:hypothetical protein CXB51_029269 [Gossypium anomalum]|uniref:Integrase catalytic domain-containing protein n=1 Tax=Gossypium anomalum TaxID=47600 RepID=A0A8J5YC49_9ROSI|nr:hypothetical protein CXB51_029269 [Gossypium anomalum]